MYLFSFSSLAIVPLILLIIALLLIFTIIIVVWRGVNKIKSSTRRLFGTSNLREIERLQQNEIQDTPKSVSSMTSLYLPMLQKDFPNLNWEEFKMIAENELYGHLVDKYTNIVIHKTELNRYMKTQRTSTAILQSAVQYNEGGVKKQVRYNTHMVYTLDRVSTVNANYVTSTCPNCGAAISSINATNCSYCGSLITPVSQNVWQFLKCELS